MPRSKTQTAARQLTDLSPEEFENLTYDLAIARGMVNVVWRTPGADGGRDIEAESVQRDISGAQTASKWYIECKKYVGSVDWPTIHPKLAYADAAGADYLLLCTSSKFSPQAITNVENWNLSRRRPAIRLWPGHELQSQLRLHGDLQLKYALQADSSNPGKSLFNLSLALSKSIGSYYSSVAAGGPVASRMLQAANALALLLQARMEEIETLGSPSRQPAQKAIDADVECSGDLSDFDGPALTALIAYLAALTRRRLRAQSTQAGICIVSGYQGFDELLTRYRDAVSAIAMWGDFEVTFDSKAVTVRRRYA